MESPIALDETNPWILEAEVHQAAGMLSVKLGVLIDEAYVFLREHAINNCQLVGDAAYDIVHHRDSLAEEQDRP